MRVRLVQPMITDHADWDAADPAEVIDRLISLSEARLTPADPGLAGITHLVWPESVFPVLPHPAIPMRWPASPACCRPKRCC